MNRWCITYFGAAARESRTKSTKSTRACWGGITASFTGAEGRARRRLQSPKPQVGSTSCLPANEAMTLVASVASTTSSLRMVAGTRDAFCSTTLYATWNLPSEPWKGNVGGLVTWTITEVKASLTVIPGGSGPNGESPTVPAPVDGVGAAVAPVPDAAEPDCAEPDCAVPGGDEVQAASPNRRTTRNPSLRMRTSQGCTPSVSLRGRRLGRVAPSRARQLRCGAVGPSALGAAHPRWVMPCDPRPARVSLRWTRTLGGSR